MTKVSLFIFSLFLSLSSVAQISIFSDYIDYSNQAKDGVNYHAYDTVYNSAKSDQDINWKIVYSYFPTGWSTIGICDNSACYPISLTGWHTTTVPAESKIEIYSNAIASTSAVSGCAIIRIQINGPGLPDTIITYTHTDGPSATACHTLGINDQSEIAAQLSVFPNVVQNYANVSNHSDASVVAGLFDMNGKKISTNNISAFSQTSFDMSKQPSGVYFIKCFNTEGQMLTVQKVIKN